MKGSLLAALVAAVLVVGGGAWYISSQNTATPVEDAASEQAAADTAAPATPASTPAASENPELLVPGPLPDQVMGDANAPVTIIEYASLTCPHCAHFHRDTLPALKQRYIDTGKVKYILREFPLDEYALSGFVLARCGGEGKYYPVVDAFFGTQQGLFDAAEADAKNRNNEASVTWMKNFATQIGLTQEQMQACWSNQQLADNIAATRERAAEKFGVNSTPTFFVNGKILRGALTIDQLAQEIDPLLKS